jgi:hypothetical protein
VRVSTVARCRLRLEQDFALSRSLNLARVLEAVLCGCGDTCTCELELAPRISRVLEAVLCGSRDTCKCELERVDTKSISHFFLSRRVETEKRGSFVLSFLIFDTFEACIPALPSLLFDTAGRSSPSAFGVWGTVRSRLIFLEQQFVSSQR